MIQFNESRKAQAFLYIRIAASSIMKRTMIRNSFYLILFSIALILSACSGADSPGSAENPVAVKGVMDLREWDFSRNGSVAIYGQWEFFWKKFIISGPPDERSAAPSGYISVPSTWYKHRLDNGKKLPARGYASYRVRILLPEEVQQSALHFPFAFTSYRVYALSAGAAPLLIGRSGDPGRTEDETFAVLGHTTALLPSGGEITLVFEVADYGSTIGGMWSAPEVGPAGLIYRQVDFARIKSFLIIGCLLVIGLYNLVFFLLRRSEPAPLWLGIFCFIIAVWTFFDGHYAEEWYPYLFYYSPVQSIYFLSLYLAFPVFFTFVYHAFKDYFPRKALLSLWAVSVFLVMTVILFKPLTFFKFLFIFHITIVTFSSLFLFYLVREGIRRRNILVLVSLVGLLAFFVAVLNDILVANYVLRTGFIMHQGFVFFIFIQAFVLSSQNAAARKAVEMLSAEMKDKNIMLMDLNLNLENKVDERTRDLVRAKDEIEIAMQELEASNEALVKTNSELEEAKRVMDFDMSMAVTIQRTFLIGAPPRVSGWDIAFTYNAMAGVSGDFYDFFQEDGVLKGASLFDVSGHGVGSGLLTLMAKALIFRNFRQHADRSLNEIMNAINAELIQEIGSIDNYLTGIILRVRGNDVEYVNAAHPPLMVKTAADSSVQIHDFDDSEFNGGYLGIKELQSNYDMKKLRVEAGDVLFLYSDCLTESFNADRESYSAERLVHALHSAPEGCTAAEIIRFILEDFFGFAGHKLQDDLTIIVLRKT